MLSAVAHAQTSIQLTTPHRVPLTPRVAVVSCFASVATLAGYHTVVTGFTAAGNYVNGQDLGFYSCGSIGYRTYYMGATLMWDLSGKLVTTSTTSRG